MSSTPGIFNLPVNCCSGEAPVPAVPNAISNPPGLAAIRYRIGTFTSFRQAMLDSVALPDLLAGAATSLTAPVSTTDTVIAVLDSSQFPLAVPFRIKIGAEYMQV